MTRTLLSLPPYIRSRLADALATGALTPPFTEFSVRAAIGGAEVPPDLVGVLRDWAREGVTGRVASLWIRSLGEAASSVERARLVWTGPSAKGLLSRNTRQVYEELVRGAHRTLWISSYTYFHGPEAFRLLAKRMDELPGMKVTLMLNIRRSSGDSGSREDVVGRFANRFWKEDWPGAARPVVYYDPRSLDRDGPASVLHAKAVVADEERLFVTSANLTEAAMDRNIEIGVLFRDRTLARTAVAHFRGLVDQEFLQRLPDG